MKETYEGILKLNCQINHVLDNAMVLCQSWGYNGLKRYYRYHHGHFDRLLLKLKNEMYDNHELVASLENSNHPSYQPTDIKDHARRWYETLRDAVNQMVQLNIALVGQTGMQSCVTKKMLHCLYKMKEKAHRFYKRGTEVQWMAHDLHVYDDCLHEKIKKKEKKRYDD